MFMLKNTYTSKNSYIFQNKKFDMYIQLYLK